VNTLRITKQELLQRLLERNIAAEGTRYSPVGITVRDIRAYEELSFAHGLCTVQDEAAQLVSYLLAPKTGDRVLDACAAPGGKTTHIAQLMGDEGEIVAADKDLLRLERLEQNIQTLGIRSVSILHADLADLQNPGTFDRILLDAPCSSLGVIRRNPDVKYRHTERDMSKFRQKQLDLLRRAASLLRKKGSLVYSVCSIEPEEGEDVVHDFLKTSREFRIIDAEEGFLRPFMSSGFFRTWPHKHDMDGFFGAILCRQE
jgi:16S rRNA (cytosine967-C5)-methyltransferase